VSKPLDTIDELARSREFVHAAYLAVNSSLLDREAANALAVVLIEAENSLERVNESLEEMLEEERAPKTPQLREAAERD
jgi:hypothetical protein